MAKRDRKALLIRIQTKTWKAIKKQAQQSNRTVTAHIAEILDIAAIPTTGATTRSGAETIKIHFPKD